MRDICCYCNNCLQKRLMEAPPQAGMNAKKGGLYRIDMWLKTAVLENSFYCFRRRHHVFSGVIRFYDNFMHTFSNAYFSFYWTGAGSDLKFAIKVEFHFCYEHQRGRSCFIALTWVFSRKNRGVALLKALTGTHAFNKTEVAERIGTTQSAVARLESGRGKHSPSIATLEKYAHALCCRLELRFKG